MFPDEIAHTPFFLSDIQRKFGYTYNEEVKKPK